MIKFDKWYLPDGEEHLQGWMTKKNQIIDGRLTYQYHKYEAATALCKQRRVAVDIGAHVGLMSYWMARDFSQVHSFEPVAMHRECFLSNCDSFVTADRLKDDEAPPGGIAAMMSGSFLHACALGDRVGSVRMIVPDHGSSGSAMIGGDGDIPLKRLDDMGLIDVDYIKLDCEGSELFALRGGENTIKRDMPVIMVEQKPGRAQRFGLDETGAVTYLRTLGYRLDKVLSGDYIMVPS